MKLVFSFNVDKRLGDGEALGTEVGSGVGGGSSSSNVVFSFDGDGGADGDGLMLRRGSSSSNLVFSCGGIKEDDNGDDGSSLS